ncbi:NlpC/P60 family protein [Alkalicoccus daliensis]|uniref:Cell wall-associated hydrolase, NlpC family n=1 Tax=Alkalicoccus daliensis TaxID=745820 RepID=A0A1G9ZC77_9BACI|nr:NlpC/P60 family protein [Alkalicoccus daliensis]SDN18864.1 Cell wall-associated hydrolase, NlpC family [Alkalicoccus daliensis]
MTNITMPGSSPAVASVNAESMKIGARGDFVKELQQVLHSKGFNSSTNIDGIFGPKTLKAVQEYQLSSSISNPNGNFYGVAGPRTLGSLGMASAAPNPIADQANAASNMVDNVIASSKKHLGSPYLWGGTTPSGFDCSGFIQHAFAENGKNLPRTVAQMWNAGSKVSTPAKGDLVFFETRTGPSHAGIYLGNNKFIHSGASTGVTVTDMDNPYWKDRYLGAKRM